jgi:hypothetical protein
MPDVVVPMDLGDAIAYEMLGGLAAILGIIAAVILWGTIIIVVGSISLIFIAIYFLIRREWVKAIVCLAGWFFVGLPISYCLYDIYGRPKVILKKFTSNVASVYELYYQPKQYAIQMNDGRTLLASSIQDAANGRSQVSADDARTIMEKKIKVKIIEDENSTDDNDRKKIKKTFLDCHLGADFKSLDVTVSDSWRGFDYYTKEGYIYDIHDDFQGVMYGSSASAGEGLTENLSTPNHRLLARFCHVGENFRNVPRPEIIGVRRPYDGGYGHHFFHRPEQYPKPVQSPVVGGREIVCDQDGNYVGYCPPKTTTLEQDKEWRAFASSHGWLSQHESEALDAQILQKFNQTH